jgi:hypothetical protein
MSKIEDLGPREGTTGYWYRAAAGGWVVYLYVSPSDGHFYLYKDRTANLKLRGGAVTRDYRADKKGWRMEHYVGGLLGAQAMLLAMLQED